VISALSTTARWRGANSDHRDTGLAGPAGIDNASLDVSTYRAKMAAFGLVQATHRGTHHERASLRNLYGD
jgi:hypothetical protein